MRSILYSIKIFAYLLYARYYHKRARYYHNHSKDIGRTQWSSSFHGTESHLPKLSNQHKYLNVQYWPQTKQQWTPKSLPHHLITYTKHAPITVFTSVNSNSIFPVVLDKNSGVILDIFSWSFTSKPSYWLHLMKWIQNIWLSACWNLRHQASTCCSSLGIFLELQGSLSFRSTFFGCLAGHSMYSIRFNFPALITTQRC